MSHNTSTAGMPITFIGWISYWKRFHRGFNKLFVSTFNIQRFSLFNDKVYRMEQCVYSDLIKIEVMFRFRHCYVSIWKSFGVFQAIFILEWSWKFYLLHMSKNYLFLFINKGSKIFASYTNAFFVVCSVNFQTQPVAQMFKLCFETNLIVYVHNKMLS